MAHGSFWHDTASLRAALVLRVVFPLVAIMIGFGSLLLWTVERHSERRLQEEVELVARAVRLPLSHGLENNRQNRLHQTLQSVLGIDRVYGAYVFGRDGELVAAAGSVAPEVNAAEIQEIAAVGEQTGEYQQIQGRHVYSYFVPLEQSGGRINGLLQVTRRQSDFERDIRDLRLTAAGLSVALAVAATLVVLLGHRAAIGKYLQRLAGSMARVAAGERHHRAPASGPQEIAALGAQLNAMLDSIAEAERRLAAQQSREADLQARLRRAQQLAAVGRLAAGVAHELGSPLSVIDGKAQRALRGTALDRPQRQTLVQIREEVGRLSGIVRQLLDFGRAAGRPPRCVPTDVLVQSACAAVANQFAALDVSLRVDASPERLYCWVDPPRFEQALTNLLLNAAQASAGGRVAVRWWRQGERLLIQVEDDGPGIPEEHHSVVFEPFFTTKPVGKGTGLGLAVVHGVVAEHGGRVELVRGRLPGAAFRIGLPLARPEENSDADA